MDLDSTPASHPRGCVGYYMLYVQLLSDRPVYYSISVRILLVSNIVYIVTILVSLDISVLY